MPHNAGSAATFDPGALAEVQPPSTLGIPLPVRLNPPVGRLSAYVRASATAAPVTAAFK